VPNLIERVQQEENQFVGQLTQREFALMAELEPLLKRRAGEREISGLRVYETRGEYVANGE